MKQRRKPIHTPTHMPIHMKVRKPMPAKPPSIANRGSARCDSSHSFNVIRAITMNRYSAILPSESTSAWPMPAKPPKVEVPRTVYRRRPKHARSAEAE